MTALPTGVFLYPWDALDEGPAHTAARIRRDLGFDRVALNVAYHSGRFLHPRHRDGPSDPWFKGVLNHRTGSSIAFEPDAERYGALRPVVDEALAASGAALDTAAAARDAGLGLDLWLVALHASTLGARHPEHCVTNAYGDVYRYALCPADADVRAYAVALVEDACSRFSPDGIVVESPTYLGFVHGDHHELIMESLDDVTRWLLGICFHPASRAVAEAAGVDADAVHALVVRLLDDLVEQGRGAHEPGFRIAEGTSLLLEHPELYAYLRARQDAVTTLVDELRAAAARHGARLRVTSSIFERPASRAWAEGVSLRAVASAADELAVVSYFPTPALVQADLDWVRTLVPDRPLHVALNAGLPDAQDAADLLAKVRIAEGVGATGVSFYNYGLLTERRLGWLRDVNAALGKEVGMRS